MRILVVEDDARVADFLTRALRGEGHAPVSVSDGHEGLDLARTADFDLIVLDLVLPGMSGLEICQILRVSQINTPIIMLTALDGVEDVVRGLRMGADDYMTKPFDLDELLARIEAIARRANELSDVIESELSAGSVVLNLRSMTVTLDDEPVEMTAKEIAVLELLMNQPDRLFSRERILSNVWGMNIDPQTNVVDVYISKIRRKLTSKDGAPFIETVRGLGYRINQGLRS